MRIRTHRVVNKDFFKEWAAPMAYVLGFFMADGYMTHNSRGAHFLCMQITDRNLLYKLRAAMRSTHKVSARTTHDAGKPLYRLQIGSKEMCDDLRKLGIRNGKTHNMRLPNVPQKYVSDFVRGYFDGDGNVWVGLVHKERQRSLLAINTVFTSCSGHFLRVLKKTLKEYEIHGHMSNANSYCRLSYSIHASLKLHGLMYGKYHGNLFLRRKRKVFERYVRNRNAAVAQR
ncbi:MAG: LAGLIDADG family homing endonuclease [Patescibacteria group bacterium]